jgi:WD40 repeat protein
MGAFFGSIQIRTTDRQLVLDALNSIVKRTHRFLISPPINGWTSVFPNTGGQDEKVSKALAKKLNLVMLHLLVHDDDVFCYWLYRDGKLIDKYNSCPEYFGPVSAAAKRQSQGKPERLGELLDVDGHGTEDLRTLLAGRKPVFESARLEQFARLCGIEPALALSSYEYLMAGETDDIGNWDDFVHVPDLTDERRQQQEEKARITVTKRHLVEEGKLIKELSESVTGCAGTLSVWCLDPQDRALLMCSSSLGESGNVPLRRVGPPWSGELSDTGLNVYEKVYSMQSSPSGRYLATGHAAGLWKAVLWDRQTNEAVLEVEHSSAVKPVCFTSDEKYLVTLSEAELIVTDISRQSPISTCRDIRDSRTMAVHPSGDTIVLGDRGAISLVGTDTGTKTKSFLLGEVHDWSAWRAAIADKVKKQFEQMGPDWIQKQAEQVAQQLGSVEGGKTVEQIQQDIDNRLQAIMAGEFFQGGEAWTKQGSETVCDLAFTPDGKHLLCATTMGFRIFEWINVLSSTEESLEPLLSVDSERPSGQMEPLYGYVYAIACDGSKRRALFGGMGGEIRYLDIDSGKSGILVEIPGRPAILKMGLAADHSCLVCSCHPGFPDVRGGQQSPTVQIWDYAKLT